MATAFSWRIWPIVVARTTTGLGVRITLRSALVLDLRTAFFRFTSSPEALVAKMAGVRLMTAKLVSHLSSAAREFRSETKTTVERHNSNPFA